MHTRRAWGLQTYIIDPTSILILTSLKIYYSPSYWNMKQNYTCTLSLMYCTHTHITTQFDSRERLSCNSPPHLQQSTLLLLVMFYKGERGISKLRTNQTSTITIKIKIVVNQILRSILNSFIITSEEPR